MTVEMDPADMTDEQAVEVKQKKVSDKENARLDNEARLASLETRPGRRLLFRILENCGMFRDCVAATPEATIAMAGGHMKAVALWSDLISTSPKLVALMIEENAR